MNNALIPKYSFNYDTGEYKILGSDRNANPKLARASLLNKVIYPTGGFSIFEYEGHDHSMKIKRNSSSNFIKVLGQENGVIGGARIKKIINTDEYNNSITREFKYIDENLHSSGIALDDIRYIHYKNYNNGRGGRTIQIFENNRNYFSNSLTSSPIEYSRVLEYKNNILYKEYMFSTYKTNPDSLSYTMKYENLNADFKPKNMNRNLELKYLDFSNRRRQLLKESLFDELGRLIREIKYEYIFPRKSQKEMPSNISNKEHTVSVVPSIYGSYYYIDFYNYNLLKKKIKKDFFNGAIVQRLDDYMYQNKNTFNIQNVITYFPNQTIQTTTYLYPHDKNNQYLISKNILGIPLETTIAQNGKVISKTETVYPTSQQEANLKTNGLPLPISTITKDLENNNKGKENIAYTKYDDKGNLLEYKINNITPVAIIYGYNQTLPIAKIEGATYEQVKNLASDIIAKSNDNRNEITENILQNALDIFRNREELKHFGITTYTHKPLIGVTSITPPNGIAEFYKYDDSNRLSRIVDINGQILKEFSYNHVNSTPVSKYFNTEKSQVFRKRTCPTNAIGQQYTYTIPQGKYISYISQEDADQKALDDISANGQNEADKNGSCSSMNCSFSLNEFSGGGGVSIDGNMYKINLSFSTGYRLLRHHWQTGVKIGYITGNCRPKSDYNSYNGRVYYTIKTNGDIIIRTPLGSPDYPNNHTLNYIFYFPIN